MPTTPLVDSDDIEQFLWLLPALMCWQWRSWYAILKHELALPLLQFVF